MVTQSNNLENINVEIKTIWPNYPILNIYISKKLKQIIIN